VIGLFLVAFCTIEPLATAMSVYRNLIVVAKKTTTTTNKPNETISKEGKKIIF